MNWDLVHRFADPEAVARGAARQIANEISKRATPFCDYGRPWGFSLVLAGGSTPRRTYEILASEHGDLPWDRVEFFWGDERCVPPDDPDSNYAMARKALLDPVGVKPERIHRIRGELGAAAAADAYEAELRTWRNPDQGDDENSPMFDLLLLGMGEDGHIASLFPGHPALAEDKRWVVPVETEAKAPRWRVSLTIPALNGCDDAYFLVTGAGKRAVLTDLLRNSYEATERYPAALLLGPHWFVDEAALGPAHP